jgi:hypothetical protein
MDEKDPDKVGLKKSPPIGLRFWTDEDRAKALQARKDKAAIRKDAAAVMEYFGFDPLKERIELYKKLKASDEGHYRVMDGMLSDFMSFVYTKPKDKLQADASRDALSDLAKIVSSGGRPLPPTAIDTEFQVVGPEDEGDDTE